MNSGILRYCQSEILAGLSAPSVLLCFLPWPSLADAEIEDAESPLPPFIRRPEAQGNS